MHYSVLKLLEPLVLSSLRVLFCIEWLLFGDFRWIGCPKTCII